MPETASASALAPSLNIVGAGHVGMALGRVFAASGAFRLQDVLTRSAGSAQRAVDFIGAGRAVADYAQLRRADVTMLAVGDDQIAAACAALVAAALARPEQQSLAQPEQQSLTQPGKQALARPQQPALTRLEQQEALRGAVLFHCSGARASADLAAAARAGALVASVHPIRSFADPAAVAGDFAGTFCGIEGDAAALALLEPALRRSGARPLRIDAGAKTVYHAAAVFASNYLVTLLDTSLRAYQAAGMAEHEARELLRPLVTETVANVLRLGPAAALSGPIARGDLDTVARQQQALAAWDGDAGALYAALIAPTSALALRKSR